MKSIVFLLYLFLLIFFLTFAKEYSTMVYWYNKNITIFDSCTSL